MKTSKCVINLLQRPHQKNVENIGIKLLGNFNNSGFKPVQYCNKYNIPHTSLYTWRKKLGYLTDSEPAKISPTEFIPISVNNNKKRLAAEDSKLEVHFPSGVKIVVNNCADEHMLNQLIKYLGA